MADTIFGKQTKPADREANLELFLSQRMDEYDKAIYGYTEISLTAVAAGNFDLSPTQAKHRVIRLKDNPAGAVVIRIPAATGANADIIFVNGCGGSFSTVTIKSTGANAGNASGVVLPTGVTRIVRHNGESTYPAGPEVNSSTGYITGAPLPTFVAPTLLNSWVNFGGAVDTAGYALHMGVVYLKGRVKNGTANSVIFNLPVGFRPSLDKNFTVNSNGALGIITVTSAGDVQQAVGSTVGMNLDGVIFAPV